MKKYISILLTFAICLSVLCIFSGCKGKKYKGDPVIPEERTEEIDGSDDEFTKLY